MTVVKRIEGAREDELRHKGINLDAACCLDENVAMHTLKELVNALPQRLAAGGHAT